MQQDASGAAKRLQSTQSSRCCAACSTGGYGQCLRSSEQAVAQQLQAACSARHAAKQQCCRPCANVCHTVCTHSTKLDAPASLPPPLPHTPHTCLPLLQAPWPPSRVAWGTSSQSWASSELGADRAQGRMAAHRMATQTEQPLWAGRLGSLSAARNESWLAAGRQEEVECAGLGASITLSSLHLRVVEQCGWGLACA